MLLLSVLLLGSLCRSEDKTRSPYAMGPTAPTQDPVITLPLPYYRDTVRGAESTVPHREDGPTQDPAIAVPVTNEEGTVRIAEKELAGLRKYEAFASAFRLHVTHLLGKDLAGATERFLVASGELMSHKPVDEKDAEFQAEATAEMHAAIEKMFKHFKKSVTRAVLSDVLKQFTESD